MRRRKPRSRGAQTKAQSHWRLRPSLESGSPCAVPGGPLQSTPILSLFARRRPSIVSAIPIASGKTLRFRRVSLAVPAHRTPVECWCSLLRLPSFLSLEGPMQAAPGSVSWAASQPSVLGRCGGGAPSASLKWRAGGVGGGECRVRGRDVVVPRSCARAQEKRLPRVRKSKEERREMVESFIKRYLLCPAAHLSALSWMHILRWNHLRACSVWSDRC